MIPARARLRSLVLSAAAAGGGVLVVALLLARLSGGRVHAGELARRCQAVPLAAIDAAAHLGSAAGFGLVLFAACSTAFVVVRQGRRSREVRRSVALACLPEPPGAAAAAAAATGTVAWVDVVEASRPFAFVYGWWRPRVCISTGMVKQLRSEELRAALLHERWHVMRRDPVRLAAATAIRAGFRFVPTFPERVEQYAVAVEVAADRFAVSEMGDARGLARALLRLETGPLAPGFAGQADARVAALLDGPAVAGRDRSWIAVIAVALEFGVSAALANGLRAATTPGSVFLCAC